MNRILALFLSMVVVVSTLIDMKDLAKIALLINHYHQAHEQISLVDFLELHYGASATRHDKEHGHKSLPFKSHERAFMQPLTAAPTFHFSTPAEPCESSPVVSHYRSVTIFDFAESIWQPPRIG